MFSFHCSTECQDYILDIFISRIVPISKASFAVNIFLIEKHYVFGNEDVFSLGGNRINYILRTCSPQITIHN